MNIVGYYEDLWPIFDAIPEGWVVDKNAGSPLHKHVFVNNGRSLLSGEQKKGLAPLPERKDIDDLYKCKFVNKLHEPEDKKPKQIIDEQYRLTLNNLSREGMKKKILKDICFDLMVCKIEGWDHKDYINELFELIQSLVRDAAK